MFTWLPVGVLLVSMPSPAVQDCDWSEVARLLAPGSGPWGSAVALESTQLIVGDSHAYGGEGAAHAFVLEDGEWRYLHTLTASDAPNVGDFGSAVVLQGDRLVVGASASGSDVIHGAAYVFEWNGALWEEQQKLTGADTVPADGFGAAIALDGNKLLVGAPLRTAHDGAVYAFRRMTTGWFQTQRLDAIDDGGQFGTAVALEGERAVIGEPLAGGGSEPGVVHVYEHSTTWALTNTIPGYECNFDGFAAARFGTSVALADPWLFVGSANYANFFGTDCHPLIAGFRREGSQWNEFLKVESTDVFDFLGSAMSLDVPRLLVTAPGRYFGAGAVEVYSYDGRSWMRTHEFRTNGTNFGDAVSVDGPLAVLGLAGDQGEPIAVLHSEAFGHVFCSGDGTDSPCPCGNASAPERGCVNSTGVGARLLACGNTSVAADRLLVEAEDLVPDRWALLLAATMRRIGAPFGDGLLCLDGTVTRLSAKLANASGGAVFGPGLSSAGGWSAGDTRFFQVVYRDPQGPCGSTVGVTSALALTFVP